METLYQIYALIFGLLIGSFLNVVILRLPNQKNIVTDRSACPKCGNKLKWFHNIPILSFLFLRGKCSFCGSPISWRYPLIELLTGLISYWLFPETVTAESIGYFFFYFSMACVFICHFFIDLDHQLLLDSLNIYLVMLILPYVLFTFPWNYWVIGGLIGFGGPMLVTWLFYKIRGQIGLGGGDIKLYGILGLLLGPTGIIFTIFFSCLVGAVIGLLMIGLNKLTKDRPMAFGPAIILVAVFQIYFPQNAQVLMEFFF